MHDEGVHVEPADLDVYLEAIDRATSAEDVRGIQMLLEEELAQDWTAWLRYLFPGYVTHGFGGHHELFWRWVWAIEAGRGADPFVAIWPRGGAKSTSGELGVTAVGARGRRRYVLYVSETQDQADDHVGNIASMLESTRLAELYPAMGERLIGKFGNYKGWRRNRIRTATGFTVDAIGLDTAARGVKLEENRPDLIVLDDLDGALDSPGVIDRKVTGLTRTLLPARAEHAAVLAVQNLVSRNGIFGKLAGVAEEPADFLALRTLSGPIPAIEGLVLDKREDGSALITAGTPTWEGQDIAICQAEMDTDGATAFLIECQHEVTLRGGGMFDHLEFHHCELGEVPELVTITVWVDPAVTDTDRSDSMGIQADGIAADGTIYRLRSWEQRSSPETALGLAISWAYELGAVNVGVETDQGGDTWRSVFAAALASILTERPELAGKPKPMFASEKAGAGQGPKTERASRMLADYERPGRRIVHVIGSHSILEQALNRFPRTKPYDLVDAAFWSWHYLRRMSQPAGTSAATTQRMRPMKRPT